MTNRKSFGEFLQFLFKKNPNIDVDVSQLFLFCLSYQLSRDRTITKIFLQFLRTFSENYQILSRVIPQIEAQKALISKIVMSRQIDHQTGSWNKFANKTVKMVIFEFIMEKWSRDPSFGSINNADYRVLIFIAKKLLRNRKSRI